MRDFSKLFLSFGVLDITVLIISLLNQIIMTNLMSVEQLTLFTYVLSVQKYFCIGEKMDLAFTIMLSKSLARSDKEEVKQIMLQGYMILGVLTFLNIISYSMHSTLIYETMIVDTS